MWRMKANFWLCVLVGAGVRIAGQLLYLVLSSATMNENLFAIMMSNVYAMLVSVYAGPAVQRDDEREPVCHHDVQRVHHAGECWCPVLGGGRAITCVPSWHSVYIPKGASV